MMMKSSARFVSGCLVVAAALTQVAAIGPCDNALIEEIMTANAADCPTHLLESMYKEGPLITFRVMSKTFSELFSCASGVLEKPEKNVAILHNKFSYTNTSLGSAYVNYTMIEGTCGFLFKYVAEEQYVGFKITYAYADGISYGYYGCSDEGTRFSNGNDIYSMCYAPAVDTPEVEASLLKCKAHMELVTGVTDLVLTPACDNDNEYLDAELAKLYSSEIAIRLFHLHVRGIMYRTRSCTTCCWTKTVTPRSLTSACARRLSPGARPPRPSVARRTTSPLRNLVYNLSIADLSENQRLIWYSPEEAVKMCVMKGKDEDNCQNYVRILATMSPGKLLVCGTNSFKPICREYSVQTGAYTLDKEKPGQAVCPYDPHHNSTAVYVDGDLYTGTVADFSGMDPIIYREPLQTEQYDSMSLNAPNFVNSFTQGDFVYFFFRETAVEYINCGKSVFSRVARVCKYDRGGPHRFRNRWTSFLKSRLNCSVQGDFPFYFNEIQSTTELIEGTYGSVSRQLLYAVFTTAANSIGGSAVCAFSLQDISDTFEGNFKEQSELNSNWLPVQSMKVPDPRPGQCVNDSRTLPDLTLNFIKTHSLMDESVPSFFKQPIVIRTSYNYRFTQIAVDPQIKTPGGKSYDVLFIGTDNGYVLKTVNADSADTIERVSPVVIEEIQVFPSNVSVRTLRVVRGDNNDGRLVVVSDSEVLSIRLHRCDKVVSGCSECVALQDPYCAWDKISSRCRSVGANRWNDEKVFYQSIATGVHSSCPASKVMMPKDHTGSEHMGHPKSYSMDSNHRRSKDTPDGEVMNIRTPEVEPDTGPSVSAADTPPPHYSVETLAMAVVAASIAALLVGFVMGYLCGRKCHKDDDDNLPYPDTEYEYFEQRQNVNTRRLAPEPKLLAQEEVTYAEPVLVAPNKPLNSPKATLRKNDNLFAFQDGYNAPPYQRPTNRDHFGTLRSQREAAKNEAASMGYRDGFGTTRSVKKVYL